MTQSITQSQTYTMKILDCFKNLFKSSKKTKELVEVDINPEDSEGLPQEQTPAVQENKPVVKVEDDNHPIKSLISPQRKIQELENGVKTEKELTENSKDKVVAKVKDENLPPGFTGFGIGPQSKLPEHMKEVKEEKDPAEKSNGKSEEVLHQDRANFPASQSPLLPANPPDSEKSPNVEPNSVPFVADPRMIVDTAQIKKEPESTASPSVNPRQRYGNPLKYNQSKTLESSNKKYRNPETGAFMKAPVVPVPFGPRTCLILSCCSKSNAASIPPVRVEKENQPLIPNGKQTLPALTKMEKRRKNMIDKNKSSLYLRSSLPPAYLQRMEKNPDASAGER